MWRHVHPELLSDPCRTVAVGGAAVVGWSFFRSGVPPEWEDPANRGGAIFFLRVGYPQASAMWQTLNVECARGAMPDEVNGVKMTRKGTAFVRADVWLSPEAGGDSEATLRWLRCHVDSKFQRAGTTRREDAFGRGGEVARRGP